LVGGELSGARRKTEIAKELIAEELGELGYEVQRHSGSDA
jgi:hypothetical protein